MTIRTSPGRTSTPVAPSPSAPDPLIVDRDAIIPGRVRPAAPLRREGPAKLTGEAKYADDLVFPGAWFGATIRSTDAHARFDGFDLDPALDSSRIAVVDAADIPGDNVVSLISDDQPILVPVGGEIQHHAEPLVLLAAADRETLRRARRGVTIRTTPLAPVLTRWRAAPCSPTTRSRRATSTQASPRPMSSSRASTGSGTRSSSTSRTTR